MPIEFGGNLEKRDGIDLYILGRTKGAKISNGPGHYAGTQNIPIEYLDLKVIRQQILNDIIVKFPRSYAKQTQAYWEEINRPWLDEAIERGADFRFIQDPRIERNIINNLTEQQKQREIFKNMISHYTYLYFEFEYLSQKGYTLLENGLMVKIK